MAKIAIKQINNTPATEGGVIVYNGSNNEWSNNDTNSILLPSGTTAERPSLALDGHQRYNIDINEFEFFENGAWRGFSDNTVLSAIGLTTGLAIGGALTINGGDNTKFDISDGNGWVVNSYTDPNNPTLATVDWTGLTAITPLGLLTDIVTYIFIDNVGAVYQQLTYPNPQDSRDYIFLGVIVHADNISIAVTNNLPRVAVDTGAQLYDLTNALGFFNINGNIITANGANLNINKTEGVAFKSGANYQIDRANPHELALPSQIAATIRYRLQDGTEYPNTTNIDPSNYDNAGVLTAIGANNATVQRVYIFPSGQIRLQYGQTVHTTIAAAIEAAPNEIFNIEQNLSDNALLIGLIVLLESATDLSDTKDAVFLRVGRFGDSSSAGSQAVGTLQQAYNNSATPEIVMDPIRGALTLLDNPTPIGAPLLEVQSNDTLTTYFDVSVTGTTISGLAYPTTDGNNNDVMTTDGAGNLFFAPAVGGSGETNLGANVGAGSDIFRDKTGVTLNFRTLIGGTNVTLTENADDITIDVASGSVQNLIETFTGDAGSYTALSATDTLNILGGTSVSTSVTGNTLTITNDDPNVDQNIYETVLGDTGATTANTTTDTLSIVGGQGIATVATDDTLTINNLIVVIDDLADVDTTTVAPTNGQVLKWNGSQWTPENDIDTDTQNLWETITSDSGSAVAGTPTDTLTVSGGTSISTAIAGDVLTITNDAPNVDQNLWETMVSDAGSIAADTTTDSFSILGGTGVSTAIAGDILTITNDSPNIVQSLWETITSDAGSAVANIATDSLGILGGTGISTSITGDNLTIVNDSPNVDQNLWSTLNSDSGSTTADNTADTLIISGGTGISTAIVGDTLTITNTIAHLQNKLDGIIAPTVTDDINAGYEDGSFWIDTVADKAYRCVDSAAGAAVWIETTLQTTDLATVAVTGDHTDLLNIGTNTHTDIDNHISATNNPHSTILWLTMTADAGTVDANTSTDAFTIAGGTGVSTQIVGDVLTITNDNPNIVQNLWETFVADAGNTSADTATDSLTINGGTGISTAIVGDVLTIVNESPNTDQNIYETFIGDAGTTTANTITDTLGILGGTGISTVVTSDTVTITNDSPNVDQDIWETFNADSGTATANTLTDIFTFTGGTGITTAIVGDVVTFTNDAPNVDQNLWETMVSDAGSVAADTTTDSFSILGGTGISTSIAGDVLTVVNDSPNVDQNLVETFDSDAGSFTATTTTDTLNIVGGTAITTSVTGNTLTIEGIAPGALTTVTSFAGLPVSPSLNDVVLYTPFNGLAIWDGTHWVSQAVDRDAFGRDKFSSASSYMKSAGNASGGQLNGWYIAKYTGIAGLKVYGITMHNETSMTGDVELHVDSLLADPAPGTLLGTALSITAATNGTTTFVTPAFAPASARMTCFIRMTVNSWRTPSVNILYSMVAGA